MNKLFTKNVTLNNTPTILNIVESPKSGKIKMPKNRLGLYIGSDGQLYKPVFVFGNTYMDKETLRDFIWHGIRNLQRRNDEKQHDFLLKLTRRYYQMHTLLVGEDKYNEKLVKTICEVEGLTLLLEVLKEEQKPYRPSPKDEHFNFEGIRLDKFNIMEALGDAGRWFNWESQQPDQKFREAQLVHMAVAAFYSSRILIGSTKKYIPEIITEMINQDRPEEDQVPMDVIKKMMKTCEIPVSKKKKCA